MNVGEEVRINDHVGRGHIEDGLHNRWSVFDDSGAPTSSVFLTSRTILGTDVVLGYLMRELAPRCAIEHLGKVECLCGFRLKITDHSLSGPQHKIHSVPVRRTLEWVEP